MTRKEFCIKDGILITYTDDDVCFENQSTADAILFKNDGSIVFNNFDESTTDFYAKYFKQIYPAVTSVRNLDALEFA